MVKHVYILGAGFSAPLGGPLFNDLLSLELNKNLDHQLRDYEPQDVDPRKWKLFRNLPDLLHAALGYQGNNDPPKRVINAEQAMELAEGLARKTNNWLVSHLRTRVLTDSDFFSSTDMLVNNASGEFFRILKSRVAYESNAFLAMLDPDSERWDPFDRWYKSLGSNDTLITTNYDLVLETLDQRRNVRGSSSLEDWDSRFTRQGAPKVYKLHGSCNWRRERDAIRCIGNPSVNDLIASDLIVGTPGLEKKSLATKLLRDVWEYARGALEVADVVSIVGYSLPETDNHMRMWLLDAIARNNQLRAVNIVLGGRTDRSFRAKSIIDQVFAIGDARKYLGEDTERWKVHLPRVYAQDFLPAYRPDDVAEINKVAFLDD